jgi:hypothetical protein
MLVSVGFELADVNRAYIDLLYSFIGCPSFLSAQKVGEIVQSGGIPQDKINEAIEALLWFGFLGIQDAGQDDPQFAYQVHYNLAKMLSLLRTGRAYLVVHPAFRSALGCT